MNWLFNNWQILFGGIAGTAVVALIGWGLKRLFDSNKEPSGQLTAQGTTVSDSPVASGTGNSQRVNSPTNIFMGLPAAATPERFEQAQLVGDLAKQPSGRVRSKRAGILAAHSLAFRVHSQDALHVRADSLYCISAHSRGQNGLNPWAQTAQATRRSRCQAPFSPG
jgi:hypothetical protein